MDSRGPAFSTVGRLTMLILPHADRAPSGAWARLRVALRRFLRLQDVLVPEGDSENLRQGLPGPLPHLLTGQVRHRVVDEDDPIAAVPLSLRHRRARLGEGLRADDGCRRPPLLDLCRVVHTARAAGPSIAAGDDDEVAAAGELVQLLVAGDPDAAGDLDGADDLLERVPLLKEGQHLLSQLSGVLLMVVEQADGGVVQSGQPRRQAVRLLAFRSRWVIGKDRQLGFLLCSKALA